MSILTILSVAILAVVCGPFIWFLATDTFNDNFRIRKGRLVRRRVRYWGFE